MSVAGTASVSWCVYLSTNAIYGAGDTLLECGRARGGRILGLLDVGDEFLDVDLYRDAADVVAALDDDGLAKAVVVVIFDVIIDVVVDVVVDVVDIHRVFSFGTGHVHHRLQVADVRMPRI